MKKLLLLLLPLLSFAQNTYLDHSVVNGTQFAVGDTLTIKFNINYEVDAGNLLIFDYEYNNKLLQKIDHQFSVSTDYQTSLTHWDGYSFNPKQGVSDTYLKDQYVWWYSEAGGASYSTDSDWSVERIVVQGTNNFGAGDEIIKVNYLIKDKALNNYTDYLDLTSLSWARYEDQSDSNLFDIYAQTKAINLSGVTGGDAGSVLIKLDTANSNPSDFSYSVSNPSSQVVATGYFDAQKQAVVTGLENDVEYSIEIDVDNQLASEWLDQVVTISDVYSVFRQAGADSGGPTSTGGNTFSYSLQYLYGEVNNSGNVDYADSYVLLNHISGNNVSTWFTSKANGSYDHWGRTENYGVSTNEYYFGKNIYFEPNDDDKIFSFAHGLIGDVDFSHSFEPTAGGTLEQTTTAFSLAADAEEYDLDIATFLREDGMVVLETNLTKEDLIGMQFIIKYDETILEFKEVVFDAGNEITNFATPKNERVFFGSIDTEGKQFVKTGKPYKLIFEPKVNITNTSGLIYFNVADAVKADGKKVILKIQ